MKTFNYKILKVMAFSVIMLFMSSTVFAQVQESQQDTTAQDTTTQMNDRQQTMPQEQNQRMGDDMKSQHPDKGVNYSETIEKSELPQDVNNSLDELYPAHEIQEAYRGENDSFKVKVKNETDEAVVYYDSEGNFLRAENLSGLNQEGELPQEQGQRTMESQDQEQWDTDAQRDTVSNQQGSQQGTQQKQWGTEDKNQDAEMQDDDRASPQEQNQRTDDALRSQDFDKGVDYSESVQEGDLPQEVTSSLDELYPAHEIQEISKGNDDSYKVKVKNEDDVAAVYYDSKGDFLRAQNLSGLEQPGALPQEQGQRIQDDYQNQKDTRQESQQDKWESDTAKHKNSTHPQEQSQRMMHDMESMMHDEGMGMKYSEKIDKSELPDVVVNSIDETYPENEISEVYRGKDNSYKVKLDIQEDEPFVYFNDKGELLKVGKEEQQMTSPQEMNQRIEDVEESQDADRWGTENRMPDQETDQQTWESDTANSETLEDTVTIEGSAYPQEQQQEIEGTQDQDDSWKSDDMGTNQSTWQGGEGTDTTSTAARIDTTAIYNNQWEEDNIEEGDDMASPQEQEQEINAWGDVDTTDTQGDYDTAPTDTTDTYNDQMMEDNTLDNDDTASPQEQYQATGDEDVDYSEEIQENELPESVTTSLEDLYPDYEIEEVYRGDDDSYKVKVKKNEEKVAVYYNSDGLFYRDEVLDDMLEGTNKNTNQDW